MKLIFLLNVILLYILYYIGIYSELFLHFCVVLILESNKDNHLNQSKMVNLTKKKIFLFFKCYKLLPEHSSCPGDRN